jgi:hypothetical protein
MFTDSNSKSSLAVIVMTAGMAAMHAVDANTSL